MDVLLVSKIKATKCTLRDLSINVCGELLRYFLNMASGYTISTTTRNVDKLELSLGYVISGNEVDKAVYYVELGKSSIYSILTGLEYLGTTNIHSPLRFKLIRVVRPFIEVATPHILTPAHLSLKKVYSIETEGEYNEFTKYINSNKLCCNIGDFVKEVAGIVRGDKANIIDSLLRVVALYMTALLSGIHRYSLALRQIAFQSVVYLYLNLLEESARNKIDLSEKQHVNNAISTMLTTLVTDTYIWIPYVMLKKVGAHGSELIYTIAANPLREIIHKFKDKKPRDVLCMLEKFNAYVKKEIDTLLVKIIKDVTNQNLVYGSIAVLERVVNDVVNKIRDILSSFYRKPIKYESLIGRYVHLIKEVRCRCSTYRLCSERTTNDKVQVLLTATEQLNPLIIDLIIRYCNELIHEYKNLSVLIAVTPQTYFNYIVTKEILQGMCSESRNINIQGYIIPTTEGLVSKIIALGIVGNINKKSLAIALIQGNMIVALPIYIELRKILGSDISKKVMFI